MAGITWWTAGRIAALRAAVRAGASYREAAALLTARYHRRVTQGAVTRMCGRLGLHGQARGGRPRKSERGNP